MSVRVVTKAMPMVGWRRNGGTACWPDTGTWAERYTRARRDQSTTQPTTGASILTRVAEQERCVFEFCGWSTGATNNQGIQSHLTVEHKLSHQAAGHLVEAEKSDVWRRYGAACRPAYDCLQSTSKSKTKCAFLSCERKFRSSYGPTQHLMEVRNLDPRDANMVRNAGKSKK